MTTQTKHPVPLLENINVFDTPDGKVAKLDKDLASSLEINVYLAYLIGQINEKMIVNPYPNYVQSSEVLAFTPTGTVVIVPNYHHDIKEQNDAFLFHGITSIYSIEDSKFISYKMRLNPVSKIIEVHEDYLDCFATDHFVNKSALKALINCLEKDRPARLLALHDALYKDQ